MLSVGGEELAKRPETSCAARGEGSVALGRQHGAGDIAGSESRLLEHCCQRWHRAGERDRAGEAGACRAKPQSGAQRLMRGEDGGQGQSTNRALIKPGTCFMPSATWQSPSHVKSTPPAASARCTETPPPSPPDSPSSTYLGHRWAAGTPEAARAASCEAGGAEPGCRQPSGAAAALWAGHRPRGLAADGSALRCCRPAPSPAASWQRDRSHCRPATASPPHEPGDGGVERKPLTAPSPVCL